MSTSTSMYRTYACTLSDATLKKARLELREDPKNRNGAVETLRDWIELRPHIKFPTDTRTLLMFLRHAKFSQIKARQTIERFCTAKSAHQEVFTDLDPTDDMFIRFLRTGTWLILPGYGEDGTKRLINRSGAYKPSEWKHHKVHWFRSVYMIWHYILMDEENQVNGYRFLADFSDYTMQHQTFFTMDEMKGQLKSFQNCFPLRYKGLHHYNCGPVFEAMFSMMHPFMDKKFRDRVIMHGKNLEKVYKVFPMHTLPEEYLPDEYEGPNAGSMNSIIDHMIKDMQRPEVIEYMKHISRPEWGIDLSQKVGEDIPSQSFRKLEWD